VRVVFTRIQPKKKLNMDKNRETKVQIVSSIK